MAITKILNIQAEDNRNPARHLEQALDYIQNPEKTDEKVLVGSINCLPDTAFEQMLETKHLYGKTGKRQGYHFIISFVPCEATAEQAFDIMKRFSEEFLGDDYEAVYSVHTDREHMHGHLIFNSVSITTGAKYDYRKGDWKRKIQPITNKLCEEYHLTIQPAEYAKHPVNLSRKEWEYEQTFKEMIYKDAMFCSSYAGSMEHFMFLMQRLGYEFKKNEYLTVKMPGRKLYHRLDQMNDYFKEDNFKYSFETCYARVAHYYTDNPIYARKNNMTPYQKRYYGKLYRLRMIEQKRFYVGSAKYAKDIKLFHKLQEEYLFLVKYDIKTPEALLDFHKEKSERIAEISKQQEQVYKKNSSKKRACKSEDDWRAYQSWRIKEYSKLDILKEEKKKAKEEMTIAANCLMEKLDTAIDVVSEYEAVGSGIKVEVPEYEAPKSIMEEKVEPETVMETESEDKYIEVDKHDDYGVELEQNLEIKPQTKPEEEQIPYKEIIEMIPEKENLPDNYLEYSLLSVTDKIKNYDFQDSEDVFAMVEEYFKQIGYKASFDELYEETAVLEKALNSYKMDFMVKNITAKMLDAGITADNYSSVSVSTKAKCMDLDAGNNSFNLSVYMKLMDKLGVKLPRVEMYEDYQGIYDEKMKLSNAYRNEENIWNKVRQRKNSRS